MINRRTLATLSPVAAGLVLPLLLTPTAGAQERPRIRVAPEITERVVARAYQGRNSGPEQTETFSRKVKIAKDGRVTVENVSGEIVVNGGGAGDEIAIEAVKRARGDRSQLALIEIQVEDRGGRVDIRTDYPSRNVRAWVDYTITVPASVHVEVRSISGDLKVSNVQGTVRGETVSGDITMTNTPRLENAKSVSGDVSLSGVSTNGDFTAGSGSGTITARGLKARAVDLSTISGDLILSDVICERFGAKSISGTVDFGGRILKDGRYEFTAHSGDVRLRLQNPGGFELSASTFSGSIRSDIQLVIHDSEQRRGGSGGRERRGSGLNRSMQATYGDGSAFLVVRTFSGDVVLTEK